MPGRGRRGSGSATGEVGTTTIWMLGLCLMLFLLGGISLDLWRAFSERRALAAAADAAAVAGAAALDEQAYRESGVVRLLPADAERLAARSLAGQVDRRAMRGSRIAADEGRVVVEVQGSVDFSLLSLLSPGDRFEITVEAVAHPSPSRG